MDKVSDLSKPQKWGFTLSTGSYLHINIIGIVLNIDSL